MEPFHNYLKNIYYVNLDHRTDRKEQFLKQMENMGLTNHSNIVRYDAIKTPGRGWVGCTKSHLNILLEAKDKNLDYISVFEDDFTWRKTTTSETIKHFLDTIKNNIHDEWDVIFLACYPAEAQKINNTICIENNIVRILTGTAGSGYIIKNRYLDTLIQSFKESLELQENYIYTYEQYSIYSRFVPDQYWSKIQKTGFWVSSKPPLGIQGDGFSDISLKVNVNMSA